MAQERFFPRTTFAAIPEEYARFEGARVVILPVPYESTSSGRAGCREAPRAIIEASEEMELYDLDLECEPYRVGIHTLAEVVPHTGDPQAMVERIEGIVGELLDGGKFVVTLGGEHTLAVGAARAHRRRIANLSVLALDAHADLRQEYLGTPYNHACVLRRLLDDGCPVVQVGLRSATREEHELIGQRKLPFFSPSAYRSLPGGSGDLVARLSDDVYVTVDLDVFDPSQMAAVGTPEPGGLLWDEVVALLAAVAKERRIVGFDVTELAPRLGPFANAQLTARLIYRLIGLAVAAAAGP
ncbi:MAG: agmatinase [Dehalococcoidia bacterium]